MDTLDIRCAKKAKEFVTNLPEILKKDKNKIENLLTKSLGILQENGVYALFLWLESKSKKDERNKKPEAMIQDLCKDLLLELRFIENGDIFDAITKLAENLEKLILTKKLIEQTLTYALYHTKAIEEQK